MLLDLKYFIEFLKAAYCRQVELQVELHLNNHNSGEILVPASNDLMKKFNNNDNSENDHNNTNNKNDINNTNNNNGI